MAVQIPGRGLNLPEGVSVWCGTQAFPSVCRAAVVTEVPFEAAVDGKIGLCVLNPDGQFFCHDVPYADPSDGPVVPGSWHWPERV